MPKREVIQSITLGRGTQRLNLTTGMVFDFTDEELAEIEASNPQALSKTTTVDLSEGDDVNLRKLDGDADKAVTKAEKKAAEAAAKAAATGNTEQL
jgi:hypothetical protein